MKLRVLGAHNLESRDTRFASLVIDDTLALDAGGLTSGLTLDEQARLEWLLLSHRHYDHVRDVPGLGLCLLAREAQVTVCGSDDVCDALTTHWLNGLTYPRLHEIPPERPTLPLRRIRAREHLQLGGYAVTPLATNHAADSLGFRIEDARGRALFYTSDTGPLPAGFWADMRIDLLIVEVTLPNEKPDLARSAGHLTPSLLQNELTQLSTSSGRLPRILAVHVDPFAERNGVLSRQLAEVSDAVGADIRIAREGMQLDV